MQTVPVVVVVREAEASLVEALSSYTTFEVYAAELGLSLASFAAPKALVS